MEDTAPWQTSGYTEDAKFPLFFPFFVIKGSIRSLTRKRRLIHSATAIKSRGYRMKYHIGITIDKDLLQKIEETRGMTKRSTFMNHLLKLGLKAYKNQQPKTHHLPSEPILNTNTEPME